MKQGCLSVSAFLRRTYNPRTYACRQLRSRHLCTLKDYFTTWLLGPEIPTPLSLAPSFFIRAAPPPVTPTRRHPRRHSLAQRLSYQPPPRRRLRKHLLFPLVCLFLCACPQFTLETPHPIGTCPRPALRLYTLRSRWPRRRWRAGLPLTACLRRGRFGEAMLICRHAAGH